MRAHTTASGEVTRLLRGLREGEPEALDRLLPLVYDELRRLARRQLNREAARAPCRPPDSSMRRT
jgi:hypothetical protein